MFWFFFCIKNMFKNMFLNWPQDLRPWHIIKINKIPSNIKYSCKLSKFTRSIWCVCVGGGGKGQNHYTVFIAPLLTDACSKPQNWFWVLKYQIIHLIKTKKISSTNLVLTRGVWNIFNILWEFLCFDKNQ